MGSYLHHKCRVKINGVPFEKEVELALNEHDNRWSIVVPKRGYHDITDLIEIYENREIPNRKYTPYSDEENLELIKLINLKIPHPFNCKDCEYNK